MPAVPNQRDWSKGELATAAEINTNIANPITFYRQRPMFLASYVNPVNIVSDTSYHVLNWGAVDVFVDSENMHDPSTNPDRITCVRPGLYSVQTQVHFQANVNGMRRFKFAIVKISTGVFSTIQEAGQPSSSAASFLHSGMTNFETSVRLYDPGVYMDAGDYIQILGGQNSGSTLTFEGAANDKLTWVCVRWVAAT